MSTLSVGTIKSNTTSPPTIQNSASTEIGTFCRAWVNFNGTFGTSPFTTANGGIRASFNVSSVTDNGAGDYTVNFTTSFADINFSVNVTCNTPAGYNTNGPTVLTNTVSSSSRIGIVGIIGTANVAADSTQISVSVFR